MTRTSIQPVLLSLAHGTAIGGALLSAAGVLFYLVLFQLEGTRAATADFESAAVGLTTLAVTVLILGLIAVAGVGGGRSTLVTYVIAASLIAVTGLITWLARSGGAPTSPSPATLDLGVQWALILPSSYPLLLLGMVGAARLLAKAL